VGGCRGVRGTREAWERALWPVRTVCGGTPAWATAVLRGLAASADRPALVRTRPDRPRCRGRRLSAPPVAEAARELGIALAQPTSINDEEAMSAIAGTSPEAICVCAYGGLIREPLLSRYWVLNVHPSLLPRWRGAAPIERAIIAGDESTGVSIMRVSAGLDAGPVCAQASEPIAPHDTYGTLAARLQALGGELLVSALDEVPDCKPQDESLATYAEKISAPERELDPSGPVAELARWVRALTPHIGAYVKLPDGMPLGVLTARVARDDAPQPGAVSLQGACPVLGCADGALELLVVQPPGRRAMSGEDFLRGRSANRK